MSRVDSGNTRIVPGCDFRRRAFQVAVKTGLRAFFNRRQHRSIARTLCPELRLPNTVDQVDTSKGPAITRFWHRKPGCQCRHLTSTSWNWGFITGRLIHAPIDADEYRLVCRTSHYGEDHFEAAFRYQPGECRVFAIRNIARDYCGWVNRSSFTELLSFGSRREEAVELYQVFARVLHRHFETVQLEPPKVCIEFAVQPALLAGHRQRALRRLIQRYQQLQCDLSKNTDIQGCPIKAHGC